MIDRPIVVTDATAKAVATDLTIGRYWRALKEQMCSCGAWINAEQDSTT